MTEITVIGEVGKAADLVQPLVSFLTESLAGQRTRQIGERHRSGAGARESGLAWGVDADDAARVPGDRPTGPNVWFATGFAGLGVTLGSAFRRLIAAGLVEDDQTWRLFEALGLPSGGEQQGRIQWLRPFHGVATKYLDRYLGWRRTVEALGNDPAPQDWLRSALVSLSANS